ncbi:hypothetical protein FB451DRAFT_1191891 [Mycena latifolia]|nr:hypothetical protein FB451DRAFT_1191891 [Mycena latifolia]
MNPPKLKAGEDTPGTSIAKYSPQTRVPNPESSTARTSGVDSRASGGTPYQGCIGRISALLHAYATSCARAYYLGIHILAASRSAEPGTHFNLDGCTKIKLTIRSRLRTLGVGVVCNTYSVRVALPGDPVPGVLKPTPHPSLWIFDHPSAFIAHTPHPRTIPGREQSNRSWLSRRVLHAVPVEPAPTDVPQIQRSHVRDSAGRRQGEWGRESLSEDRAETGIGMATQGWDVGEVGAALGWPPTTRHMAPR